MLKGHQNQHFDPIGDAVTVNYTLTIAQSDADTDG